MREMKRIALVMIAGLLLCLGGCQKSLEEQIQEQLELGQRYLTESAYEEAIVAFSKVIELDAKNVPAYMGLGQVYEKQAEQAADAEKEDQLYNLAIENYEKVRELEPENMPAYEALVLICRKLTDYTRLLGFIEMNPENSANQDVIDICAAVRYVEQLKELCAAGQYDKARDMLGNDEYKKLDPIMKDGKLIIPMKDGKGMGLYSGIAEPMIYHGDYQGQMRHGHGVWIAYWCKYYAEGEWVQDVPNGYQEVQIYEDDGRLSRHSGSVENGHWEGVCRYGFELNGEWYESDVSYTNGRHDVVEVREGHSFFFMTETIGVEIGDPDRVYGIAGFYSTP